MSNLSTSLGIAIKIARSKCGMTQQQLADLSEMKKQDISAIENGKRALSTPLIERLANALNMDVEVNFSEKPDGN